MAERVVYRTIAYGEWTRPRLRNFREQCCDCGLIHRFDFRLVDGRNMITELAPPGWLLQPQSWPYWMPNALLGQLALPGDDAERSSDSNRQQLFGPHAAAASVRAGSPAWLESAASSLASAGILGSLTRSLAGDSQPPLNGPQVRAMRNAAVEFGLARESRLQPKGSSCGVTPTRTESCES
jgi:hypothetical protein